MPTINDYKKKALNDAGYSGDINTAEWKWLKDICSPYVGAIPDMWRYALKQSGFTGGLIEMQNELLKSLGHTDISISNKWYKYWRDTPLERVGVPSWVTSNARLDLDFANSRGFNWLDRTKTTPDSILTYTSPSPKMVYGDDGVLRYAPHNLLTRSQEFDNAAWVKTDTTVSADATVAPNGAATADLLTEGSAGTGQVGQTVSILSGIAFTVSLSLKRGNTNWLRIQVVNVGDFFRLWVNLNTGAIGTAAGGGSGVYISSSITAEAGGWYRVSITGTLPATSATLFVNTSSADNSSTRVSGGTYYPWGAQISRGSAALTYVPTTSAAVYSLPIDHNPTTFEPLGVLIEEQRTNLLLQSQTFETASWTKGNTTISANAVAAPDGTTTADAMLTTAVTGTFYVLQAATTTAAAYTFSIYAKPNGYDFIFVFNGTTGNGRVFNVATGAKGGTAGNSAPTSDDIVAVGNGWYRCSITVTCTAAANSFRAYVMSSDAGSAAFTADGVSGLYLWGAQLEAGAFATSLIPTVASQVTRAADQVSILTSAFGYNAAAGTMVVAANPIQVSTSAYPASLDDGASNELIGIRIVSSRWRLYVRDNSADQANIDAGSAQASVMGAAAAAWAADDFAISRNGASALTDGTGTLPTVTKLNVGRVSAGDVLNGHIKRLTYFPTRRTNADLQGLTT